MCEFPASSHEIYVIGTLCELKTGVLVHNLHYFHMITAASAEKDLLFYYKCKTMNKSLNLSVAQYVHK